MCGRFGSRVSYIKNFNLFLFVPDYSALRHAIPGLLLDILRVGEDFCGGEAYFSAMRHAIPGLLLDILRVGEDFYGGEAD